MNTQLKIFRNITRAVYSGYYTDLGQIELIDESTLENIKISAVPHEGVHKDMKYKLQLNFKKKEAGHSFT